MERRNFGGGGSMGSLLFDDELRKAVAKLFRLEEKMQNKLWANKQ